MWISDQMSAYRSGATDDDDDDQCAPPTDTQHSWWWLVCAGSDVTALRTAIEYVRYVLSLCVRARTGYYRLLSQTTTPLFSTETQTRYTQHDNCLILAVVK